MESMLALTEHELNQQAAGVYGEMIIFRPCMLQGEIIERTITTVIVDESLRVLHCVTSSWMKSDKNIDDMLEKRDTCMHIAQKLQLRQR